MKSLLRVSTLAASGLFLFVSTGLASLVVWDMTDEWQYPGNSPADAPTPQTHPPAIVPTGVSASDFTRGPGLTATRLHHGFSASGWNNSAGGPSTLSSAMADGNWFEVSFTVDPGYELSFLSLDYRTRRSATADGRTAEQVWQYSFDGFDTVAGSFGQFSMAPGTGTGNGITLPTVDLSGIIDLQNLVGGSTVTMRLYAHDSENPASATTGGNTFGFGRASNTSGVTVDPDLPEGGPVFEVAIIPEPGTYALFAGLVVLSGVFFLRRHRS